MNLIRKLLIPVMIPVMTGYASQSLATDCALNPFDAYNIAVKRGWHFSCKDSGFTPYAHGPIACTKKTPSILPYGFYIEGFFFTKEDKNSPFLKNNWHVQSYEVTTHNWKDFTAARLDTRIHIRKYVSKPNTVYTLKLTKITLRKTNGICSKALDEAF